MSSVFAPEKGRTFTLNFLGIRVSSICTNIESPVTRHLPFGHAFVLTLSVSLLLILWFVSLLLIFPWIIFILVTVSNYHVGVNIYSWWHDFLISINRSFIFLTYLLKHSCWVLGYWSLDIVEENFHVNFLDWCTVVLLIHRQYRFLRECLKT